MKRNVSLEKLSQIAIIIVAICALFVSILQVVLLREHNRLTVRPFLDSYKEYSDSVLTVSFSNEGFGPAILKNISFSHENVQYTSIDSLLDVLGETPNVLGISNYGENSFMASGDISRLVTIKSGELRTLGIEVSIRYESIYKESAKLGFTF